MSMTQFSGSGAAVRAFQLNAGMLGGIQLETGQSFTSLLIASGSQESGPAWHSQQSKFQLSKSFSGVSGSIIQAMNYLHSKASTGDGDVKAGSSFSTDNVIMVNNGTAKTIDNPDAVLLSNGYGLDLNADSVALRFGADNDVTLTHAADTGLLLNSSRQLQFGDTGTYIHQSADGVLDLVSDTEIEINATTIDINGAIDASSTITAAGRVIVDDATEATSTTDGSLQTDGGLSVAKSAVVGDDLSLLSDAAVLNFGADEDVSLTHVADTGVLLNSSRQLQFGDSGTYIHQSADGVLDLVSDTEIEINATTIDVNGAIDASSTITAAGRVIVDDATEATSTTDGSLQTDGGLSVAKSAVVGDDLSLLSDAAVLNFGADEDVSLTHVADTGVLLNSSRQLQFGDSGTYIHQSADGVLDLVADTEIEINATTIDVNGAIDASSTITAAGRVIVDDTTEATSTTDGSLQTDGGLSVAKDAVFGDDVKLLSDAAVLNFGADNDVSLTHVADTGLTLNTTRKLMFTDGNAFIHHDGTGITLQDDLTVAIAATMIQLGTNTSHATNITGQATSSMGVSVEPVNRVNNSVQEPVIKISGSMLNHLGTDPISFGASAASASLDAIPYMQIMGVDAGGLLQQYKIQVSGGMLQLNQV